MSDRELLELAAKAAGVTIHAANQAQRDACGAGDVGLWINNDTTCWNPLTDDGDALRLAVRCAQLFGFYRFLRAWLIAMATEQGSPSDPCAATRLAIVRAAAQIGDAIRTGGPV